ncbi:MAG: SMP-30/gluconolactonase/LRE family protein, partial [Syntrophothermus sp.]
AGTGSYMNDVKFIGGHGSMNRGPINAPQQPRQNQPAIDPAWDTQYWSLWITNGGGGVFKDIWSASTYAANGVYVSNTSAPGRIYAMSVEHHVRNEVRFNNVSNWKVYALQLEEESRESWNCQPMEIEKCSDMLFANLYMFRVIRMINPYPYSARTWNCSRVEFLNVHNYSQIKYTTSLPLYDMTNDIQVRPMEFTRLYISGKIRPVLKDDGQIKRLARGFEFAEGACRDSRGNVYFSEQRWKRIYKWNHETNTLSMVADFPWEPLSLACDTKDNLLVVFKYWPQPGYLIDGKPEAFTNPEDAAGTSFSMWGNSGFATFVYSINPEKPEESIKILAKEKMPLTGEFAKALYPSNRWRDWHDFDEVSVRKAAECWMAPDGITIIPVCYDLARSSSLIEAVPGKPLYASDEYDKRIVKFEVGREGYLSKPEYFAEKGEFSAVTDGDGNVYVADGEIYVFDKTGKAMDMIRVPQRPVTITLGGSDMKTLYITTASELYGIRVKDYTKQSMK